MAPGRPAGTSIPRSSTQAKAPLVGQVQLFANPWPFSATVTLGGGQQIQLRVGANEAFYDKEGYVRLFSMRFSDGTYGNFKLLPHQQTAESALRFCQRLLGPFGLAIASNAIFSGTTIVHSLALELFRHGEPLIIADPFANGSIDASSYYAVESGENLMAHPIRLPLG
ncbi:MAG TPA: hypothetical protein PKD86_14065 [Gemmatales bacterium]|nr:hypothetical protein [Gemmatales bacterium]